MNVSENLKSNNSNKSNNNQIICNKQDMILKVNKETKNYTLDFEINNNINLDQLSNIKIYEIIGQLNNNLIDKVELLEQVSEGELNILFVFKEIATSIGIPRKYMLINIIKQKTENLLMYTSKNLDINVNNNNNNNNIDFSKYNVEPSDRINCKLGNLTIIPYNNKLRFNYEFNLDIHEDLPMYMEHLIGLIVKKVLYNLKLYMERDSDPTRWE